jgi:hypothetical protein
MRSLNKSAAVFIGCFISALVVLAPPFTQGDEWNLTTRFTVNHSFEVPGMVLQPNTPYVIRLLDSPSTRNVVQIYNEDQTEMLTMFMAVSAERQEATDETVFTFIETEPEFPLPIREWFYPGRLRGLEFVYPKKQAIEIARHAREPILSSETSDLHDLNTVKVEAIGEIKDRAPVAETSENVTKTETAQVFEEKPSPVEERAPVEPYIDEEHHAEQENVESIGQIAQDTESKPTLKAGPEVQQQKPTEAPAITEEDQELPRTAGELPLIALIGLLCVGAGLGLKVISAKS